MRFLFLLFIVMPVLEMWLLITVGTKIGALYTIGLVLLTAVIGAKLLREQGLDTLWRGRSKLQEGQLPAQEIAEGMIIAISGALLLTPGFFTDAVGFAGLIPPVRAYMVQQILSKMVVTNFRQDQYRSSQRYDSGSGDVIDGESWDNGDGIDKFDR
ncbi:MAG: FxsA family protein [Porticoccaceae bacterium]|nr:FxsA family protein [Porticoccaceae bacterium]MBT7374675.1 FxsA family protein [Porticoccaceae bacterium]